MSKLKLAGVIALVVAAAMVPLYGDPRNAPVTHPEWARMLLRALDMENAVERSATASQVFSILSWKNSLAYEGPHFASADGIRVGGDATDRYVTADKGVGEVVYPLAVTRGGSYRLRARLEGDPSRPASAEIVRFGKTDPTGAFTLVPAATLGWVDGGSTHLDPGAYSATVLLPAGTSLHSLEVAPPCVAAIEPIGGWGPTEPLDTEDVAVTAVKALDKEWELPPAATAIEVSASDFQIEPLADGTRPVNAQAGDGQVFAIAASTKGLRVTIFLEIKESGLYTISMLGVRGAGMAWLTDSCRKAILCGTGEVEPAGWHVVTTAPLAVGRHVLSVILSPGAAVQSLRAERKKETGPDYVSTLARLGFDVGPAGPMPRPRAVDAMHWLEGRATELLGNTCGDVVLPFDQPLIALGEPATLTQPQAPPLGSGPGVLPLGPPLVPPETPQPSVSPSLPPSTPPSEAPPTTVPPTTTPASPRPSPIPTPTPTPTPPVSPSPCVSTPDLPNSCPASPSVPPIFR